MPSIIPSTRQVNEGDSLSHSLSGFVPRSTVYFKVAGRGINKKDFTAGGLKGKVKVDSNGLATISHRLRADKVTEVEESFSVQAFSDKRMRNSLGNSDAVTVFDTSVKASKPPKDGGGNGGNQIPGGAPGTSDPITGLRIQYIDRPTNSAIFSDTVYSKNSPQLQGRAPETLIDSEMELSENFLISTYRSRGADGSINTSRGVYKGSFEFSDGALKSAKISSFARYSVESKDFFGNLSEDVEITNFPSPRTIEVVTTKNYDEAVGNDWLPRALERFRSDGIVRNDFGIGRFEDIFSFGGGGLFTQNWWLNPYTPNLI